MKCWCCKKQMLTENVVVATPKGWKMAHHLCALKLCQEAVAANRRRHAGIATRTPDRWPPDDEAKT